MKEKVFCGSVETTLLKHISDLKKEIIELRRKIDKYEKYILESCEGERCAYCGIVIDGNSVVKARSEYESWPCCSKGCAMTVEAQVEDELESTVNDIINGKENI